jgi:hypothetical protein
MIDKSFIEKIEALAKNEMVNVENRPYSTRGLIPVKAPEPAAIGVRTLTAIKDYLVTNLDSLEMAVIALHVETPERVKLIGRLGQPFFQRNHFLLACPSLRKFTFGGYYPVEQFIIGLQTSFVQTEITTQMIKLVGNLSDERVVNFNDDGVTQKVTAKTGIARVAEVSVPSPVILQPYRTFLEVEQPASKFLFRIRGAEGRPPECCLFEADGGNWELIAMASIKDWLKKNISGVQILA